jgi:hypothetical protein
MSRIDLERLTELLVERLNPVLPDGIRVEANGDLIEMFGPDGSWGSSSYFADDPARTVEGMLSSVQDDVAHVTRGTAWPGNGHSLPLPWASVEGRMVFAGYDDGVMSVLRLEPIPLSEFVRDDGDASTDL